MKKLLCAMALIATCGVNAMNEVADNEINYHLFQGISNCTAQTNVDNEKNLEQQLSDCKERFQSADCGYLDETAKELIPELKVIFLGNEADETLLSQTEEDFFNNKMQISTAISNIMEMRKGLPFAALFLANMYEQVGIENIALLWAKIAYNLGEKSAEQLGKHLLLKIRLKIQLSKD